MRIDSTILMKACGEIPLILVMVCVEISCYRKLNGLFCYIYSLFKMNKYVIVLLIISVKNKNKIRRWAEEFCSGRTKFIINVDDNVFTEM